MKTSRRGIAASASAWVAAGTVVALVGLVALAALAGRAAAAGPSIVEITDAPESFAGAQVTVVGTVAEPSVGHDGESLYTLADGGRTLSVLSRSPVPVSGTRLAVTGEIVLRPPDTEFTFPPVLVESSRDATP